MTPPRARRARFLPLLLALVLAAPALPAGAQWTQWGGDAAHDARTGLGELDVQRAFPLLPDGLQVEAAGGAGVVEAAGGLLALGRAGNDCFLLAGAPGATLSKASPAIACPLGGRLAAWDEDGHRALVCLDGASTDPLLQAWPLGASSPAWTRAPGLAAPDPLSLGSAQGGNGNGAWGCSDAALDRGTAYVPFSSTVGRNRLEALRLADGSLVWGTSVPADTVTPTTPLGQLPMLPPVAADPLAEASGVFRMDAVAVTRTGLLVTGRLDGNPLAQAPPGAAWFTLDGTLRGTYTLSPAPTDPTSAGTGSTLYPASVRPAADGNLAAALVGDSLFLVDPANPQGRLSPIGGAVLSQARVAGPCWGRDSLFLPGESVGFILPGNDLGKEPQRWPGYGLGRVQECVVTGATAWVAVTRLENGTKAELLSVDLAHAQSTERVPLPFARADAVALNVHLTPVAGGSLLAWDDAGEAALLGPEPAAAAPDLSADDGYPGTTAAAQVHLDLPPGAPANTTLLLAWGDGTLDTVQPGLASRTYGEDGKGDRTVRLTAVYPDGRTATARTVLHVGQTAPVAPTILEVLFGAQYQNYTFFVIGLLVTAVSAFFGAMSVAKGRKRIDRRLRELDRIQEEGRREPFAAIRSLHAYRQDRRGDLAHGHLDDTQYTVLEAQADHVLGLIRQRILGAFVGRVSDRFTHALDTALGDGAFDELETKQLETLVDEETSLSVPERERLRALVRQWHRAI